MQLVAHLGRLLFHLHPHQLVGLHLALFGQGQGDVFHHRIGTIGSEGDAVGARLQLWQRHLTPTTDHRPPATHYLFLHLPLSNIIVFGVVGQQREVSAPLILGNRVIERFVVREQAMVEQRLAGLPQTLHLDLHHALQGTVVEVFIGNVQFFQLTDLRLVVDQAKHGVGEAYPQIGGGLVALAVEVGHLGPHHKEVHGFRLKVSATVGLGSKSNIEAAGGGSGCLARSHLNFVIHIVPMPAVESHLHPRDSVLHLRPANRHRAVARRQPLNCIRLTKLRTPTSDLRT